MQAVLQQLLEELRREGLSLSDTPGAGALENLRGLSLPPDLACEESELVAFLREALAIRRAQARAQPVRPVTFYVWHDEQAGQLRFSTAQCTPGDLPFRAPVELAGDAQVIARDFLDSRYGGCVPWTELQDIDFDAATGMDSPRAPLKVWAVELDA